MFINFEKVIGKVDVKNKKEKSPDAPGMLAKHYAPRTKTYLVDDIEKFIEDHREHAIGLLKFTGVVKSQKVKHIEILSPKGDLNEAAANLYDALHRLDQLALDLIVTERFPDHDLGKSINDRLERAAQ